MWWLLFIVILIVAIIFPELVLSAFLAYAFACILTGSSPL